MSDVCLTSAYLSRTSGLCREQRGLGRLGTGVAHAHRGLNASGSCSGERGNVLGVGNYCYVAVCSAALGASAPTEGGEGRGHIVAAAAYSLF